MRLMWLVTVAMVLLGTPVFGQDDLMKDAQTFITENSTPEAEAKWRKRWAEKAEQMQRDNQTLSGEEACADEAVWAFLVSNRDKLKVVSSNAKLVSDKKDEKQVEYKVETSALTQDQKLELCRWYVLYHERGWNFAENIDRNITRANYVAWISKLAL